MDVSSGEPATGPTAPRVAADLDTATLLSLAGASADAAILSAMRDRGFDVTRAHGYVFQRLLAGDQTVTALAADLGMTQQGASKHVADLERLGLVARRVSPDDGRARLVGLTEDGRAAIRVAREARQSFEERLRASVGEEQLAVLRRALGVLLDDAGISARIPDRSIPLPE